MSTPKDIHDTEQVLAHMTKAAALIAKAYTTMIDEGVPHDAATLIASQMATAGMRPRKEEK